MERGSGRRPLLAALFLLALGGLLLHLRIHPFYAPNKDLGGAWVFHGALLPATIGPLLDVVLVTWLFSSRRTAAWGYLLNGLIVIYGTVLMTHFSIAVLAAKNLAPLPWLFKSTLPDIALAWADFFTGAALYRSWMRDTTPRDAARTPAGL